MELLGLWRAHEHQTTDNISVQDHRSRSILLLSCTALALQRLFNDFQNATIDDGLSRTFLCCWPKIVLQFCVSETEFHPMHPPSYLADYFCTDAPHGDLLAAEQSRLASCASPPRKTGEPVTSVVTVVAASRENPRIGTQYPTASIITIPPAARLQVSHETCLEFLSGTTPDANLRLLR